MSITRLPAYLALVILALSVSPSAKQQRGAPPGDKGYRLEDLAWPEAESLLTSDSVVVVPLGAGSKEHGPHLKLRNDLTLAEYLTRRVLESSSVVVAPTLTYHHYPAFEEYPGSTSLALGTARDMTADVVRTLARPGPRGFYVLNTGISTTRALEPAAAALATEGVLMRYTDYSAHVDPAARGIVKQEGGTHADEIETSIMLYINPSAVDMRRAVKDYTPSSGALRLTRVRGGTGTYSPTGTWGDPTLATAEKGRVLVEALVAGILEDIRLLRLAPLPNRSSAPRDPVAPPTPRGPTEPPGPRGCTTGDERTIRNVGNVYLTNWMKKDAQAISELWAPHGNMVHPDGTFEGGRQSIAVNRAQLFARPEYSGSWHPLRLTMVTCLTGDVAVADGVWELRGIRGPQGTTVPTMEGQCTLVMKRYGGDWLIEAYRYTIKPQPNQTTPPSTMKRPGSPDAPQ